MKSTGSVFSSRNYIGQAEPPATVLEDESRYGSDGVFAAANEPNWVQLPSGLWVMDFVAAQDDFVEITPAPAELNFTTENFTILFWLNLDSVSSRVYIYTKGLINTDGYAVRIDTGGLIEGYLYTSGSNTTFRSGAASVTTGIWYLLGIVRNGTVGIIYQNAVDVTAYTDSLVDPVTSARTAKFGIYDDKSSNPFDGKFGLPQLLNYALSAEQIAAIFQSERHWFGV